MNDLADADLADLEPLALRAADGDAAVWPSLVERLWPALQRVVRRNRAMGALAKSEDHVRDVLTETLAKLGGEGGRGLKLYKTWRERHADKTFGDWIRIVTANVIRDHLRAVHGESHGPAAARDLPSVKGLFNEFAGAETIDRIGTRPPMTAAQTARELLEFAANRLPQDQCAVLARWIEGAGFEEIRDDVGLGSAVQAQKLLRAAIATLRREFVVGRE